MRGHLDIVCFLVEAGADKEKTSDGGSTPLLIAVYEGHLDIVRFLVEAGAGNRDRGLVLLMTAAVQGYPDIFWFLVEHRSGIGYQQDGCCHCQVQLQLAFRTSCACLLSIVDMARRSVRH